MENGNFIHHFGKFCSIFNWEGADIRPKFGKGKSMLLGLNSLQKDPFSDFPNTKG